MENEQDKPAYGKRPLWQWIALYAVIAVILYGLIYYFVLAKKGTSTYDQTGNIQQPSPTTSQAETSPTGVMAAGKITVEGNEFAFIPSTITLKKGEVTEITFKNTGKFPHNLTISGLSAQSKTIKPGEEDTFTVTPDKTGSFPFSCTVGTHADKGMVGTATVE